jgi:hypothetical protein
MRGGTLRESFLNFTSDGRSGGYSSAVEKIAPYTLRTMGQPAIVLWLWGVDAIERDVVAAQDGETVS